MAAIRQLLNRGLLAGRRAATAPPRPPRAFSPTTTGVSSHVQQFERIFSNYESMQEPLNEVLCFRYKYYSRVTVVILFLTGVNCVSGHVAPYLYPGRSSKSPSQEIE